MSLPRYLYPSGLKAAAACEESAVSSFRAKERERATGEIRPDTAQTAPRFLPRGRPELYTHFYLKELPERFHAMVDTRRMGPGERIVFEPYTREVFQEPQDWIAERDIFPDGMKDTGAYEEATITVAAE